MLHSAVSSTIVSFKKFYYYFWCINVSLISLVFQHEVQSTVFSPHLFQAIYSTSHHLSSLFPRPHCLFTSLVLTYRSHSTQMFITSISPLSPQIIQFLSSFHHVVITGLQ